MAKAHLKLVTPATKKRAVTPRRRPNNELRSREHLTESEVEKLIRPIKGFVSYFLVRTSSGGFSVSVFQDKTGADESIRVAREWISKNAGNTGAAAPVVLEGETIVHLK